MARRFTTIDLLDEGVDGGAPVGPEEAPAASIALLQAASIEALAERVSGSASAPMSAMRSGRMASPRPFGVVATGQCCRSR